MRNRYVRSWPDKPGIATGERAYEVPIAEALTRSYTTDAHHVQYTSPVVRRLSAEALDTGTAVTLNIVVLDVDCPETHGTPEPAPESWRVELRGKMAALHDAHPSPYYFETKGGARIMYRLPEPAVISAPDQSKLWSQYYALLTAYVARRFGIEADPACGDWQRLFRLPRATRDGAAAPESWLVVGDADAIGALHFEPSADDINVAMSTSKAFHVGRIASFTPDTTSDGYGLLYHALRNRGHIVRARSGGGYFVQCPRDAMHSSGRVGDSSTVLYLPAPGEVVGALHCKHAHCVDLSQRDWVAEFSRHELDAAARDAGIPDRRASL